MLAEFVKCWPVSDRFQKKARVPDWPPHIGSNGNENQIQSWRNIKIDLWWGLYKKVGSRVFGEARMMER